MPGIIRGLMRTLSEVAAGIRSRVMGRGDTRYPIPSKETEPESLLPAASSTGSERAGADGSVADPDDPGAPATVVVMPIEDVLDLHTFRPEDVKDLLDDYLTEARARGLHCVRIVHGKGKGVLRRRVQAILSRHPLVASFAQADQRRGGWGATEVWLRSVPDQDDETSGPG